MNNQNELKKILKYSKATGVFIWKIDVNARVKAGSVAGTIDKTTGYIKIRFKGKNYYAHRLAWLYVYGKLPNKTIDHKNKNKADNKIANLRDIEHQLNCENRGKRTDNTSGVVGVTWHKTQNKWLAKICVMQKQIHIGVYEKFDDAVKARKEAEKIHFT